MLKEEMLVREIFASWEGGVDAIIASWRRHCDTEIVWWNSARGALSGLPATITAIENMAKMTGAVRWRSSIKELIARPGLVFTERVDAIYRADGSAIAEVPIAGVIAFRGDKIISWRDYCDDWMRDHRRADTDRALA